MTETNTDQKTALEDLVNEKSNQVKAMQVSYSIRELRSMFEDGDINIQPEFQRIFRWTDQQRSSLIESLLLSIPLPAIFVSEVDDGSWEVIDGVQRLSTVFSFMGLNLKSPSDASSNDVDNIPDEEDTDELSAADNQRTETRSGFPLHGMEYLTVAEGMTWNDLPKRLQRKIETSRIDVTQVSNESSPEAKYNLFLRLNSGSTLSTQELRNGMLVMINYDFFSLMKKCSSYPPFIAITQVSKKKREQAFQDELVLRFFMQVEFEELKSRKSLANDFGDELTAWAKNKALSFSKSKQDADSLDLNLFKRTVDLVRKYGGNDVFRMYSAVTDSRKGPVSNAAFEFVMSGVAANIEKWEKQPEELENLLKDYWTYEPFSDNKGQGVNARERFPVMVSNGRKFFS